MPSSPTMMPKGALVEACVGAENVQEHIPIWVSFQRVL